MAHKRIEKIPFCLPDPASYVPHIDELTSYRRPSSAPEGDAWTLQRRLQSHTLSLNLRVRLSAGQGIMQPSKPQAIGRSTHQVSIPNHVDMARQEEVRAEYINDFFAREYRKVMTFVMLCGANIQQAEDAAQEAFITAWQEAQIPGRWERIRNPEGWIRVVALRKYQREGRSVKRHIPLPFDRINEILEPSSVQMDLTAETLFAIDAIRSLDPELRPIMVFFLEGFSGPEIASSLGIKEQKIRDRIKKSRKVLRVYLAGTIELGIGMQMDQVCGLNGAPRPRKISESGLDKMLSAAHHELVESVDSVTYSARALAAIIEVSADDDWAASINTKFRLSDVPQQPESGRRWIWSCKSMCQPLMRLGAIASLVVLVCLGIASNGSARTIGKDSSVDYRLAASVATAFYTNCVGINSMPETRYTSTDQCMRLADPALRRQISISNSISLAWEGTHGARQIEHVVVLEVTQPLGAPMSTGRVTYLSIVYATTGSSSRNPSIGNVMLKLTNTHGIWLVSRAILPLIQRY